MTIADYREHLKSKRCKWCRQRSGTGKKGRLDNAEIKNWTHSGGYPLEGYMELQWLSAKCPNCDYEWSFHKLGIPPVPMEEHIHQTLSDIPVHESTSKSNG